MSAKENGSPENPFEGCDEAAIFLTAFCQPELVQHLAA
jgi:hypothetical protein